ncbi:LysR family transcriptional regulator [Polaromonas sp. A23]|nr:LysR family transcriptional regulator [Polaromonas sp. A23]
MQVFTEVADRGSLTEAGEALDISRAMVSRYLESLESWLGARLLHRTTRRVSLTDAGAEALPRCRQVLELTNDVQAAAGARSTVPTGKLRITASTSFAQAHLAAAVSDFLKQHTQTQIELIALERTVNLVEERMDLAIRIGNQLDDTLVARRLASCHSVVCAAPAYLAAHGTPTTPEQLRTHRCLTHAHVGPTEWRLQRDGKTVKVPVSGPLQSNEVAATRQAALDGLGVALMPTYFISADVAEGRLVRLLPGYEPETLGIHAVYLSRQHQPLVLRVMLDFLAKRFSGDVAPWDRPAKGGHATKVAKTAKARAVAGATGSATRAKR